MFPPMTSSNQGLLRLAMFLMIMQLIMYLFVCCEADEEGFHIYMLACRPWLQSSGKLTLKGKCFKLINLSISFVNWSSVCHWIIWRFKLLICLESSMILCVYEAYVRESVHGIRILPLKLRDKGSNQIKIDTDIAWCNCIKGNAIKVNRLWLWQEGATAPK